MPAPYATRTSGGASTSGRGCGGPRRAVWLTPRPRRKAAPGAPVVAAAATAADGNDDNRAFTSQTDAAFLNATSAGSITIVPSSSSTTSHPPATIAALMKTALQSATMPDVMKRRLLRLGAERGLDWGDVIADASYTPASDWTTEPLPPVSVTVNVSVDVPVDGLSGSGEDDGGLSAKLAAAKATTTTGPKRGFGASKPAKSKAKAKAAPSSSSSEIESATIMPVALRAALAAYSDGLYCASDTDATTVWTLTNVLSVLVDRDMDAWLRERVADEPSATLHTLATQAATAASEAAAEHTVAVAAERAEREARAREAYEAAKAKLEDVKARAEASRAALAAVQERLAELKKMQADLQANKAMLKQIEEEMDEVRAVAGEGSVVDTTAVDVVVEEEGAVTLLNAGEDEVVVAAVDDDADAAVGAVDDEEEQAVALADDDVAPVAAAADDDATPTSTTSTPADDTSLPPTLSPVASLIEFLPLEDDDTPLPASTFVPSRAPPSGGSSTPRGRAVAIKPVHWRIADGYIAPALRPHEADQWKAAGVLLYTFDSAGELMVLLGRTVMGVPGEPAASNTQARRRSWNLLGGKRCARDATAEATALREVMEETGALLTPDMLRGPLTPVLWCPGGLYAVFMHCLPPGETAWSLPERFDARRRVGRVTVSAGRDTANLEWVRLSSLVLGRRRLHIFMSEMLHHTRLLEWLLQRQAERLVSTDDGRGRAGWWRPPPPSGKGSGGSATIPFYEPRRFWLADLSVDWGGPNAPPMPKPQHVTHRGGYGRGEGDALPYDPHPTTYDRSWYGEDNSGRRRRREEDGGAWRPAWRDDGDREPRRRHDVGDDRGRSRRRSDDEPRRWRDDDMEPPRRRREDDVEPSHRRRERRRPKDEGNDSRPRRDDADDFGRRRRDDGEAQAWRRADDDDRPRRPRREGDETGPWRPAGDTVPSRRPRRDDTDHARREPSPSRDPRYWDNLTPTSGWVTNDPSRYDDGYARSSVPSPPPPRRGDRPPPRRSSDRPPPRRRDDWDDGGAWPPSRRAPYEPYSGGGGPPYSSGGAPPPPRRRSDPARTTWADRRRWQYASDDEDGFYRREGGGKRGERGGSERERAPCRFDDDDDRDDRWERQTDWKPDPPRGRPPTLPLPPAVTTREPLQPTGWPDPATSPHKPVKKGRRRKLTSPAPPTPIAGLGAAAATSFLPQARRKKREE